MQCYLLTFSGTLREAYFTFFFLATRGGFISPEGAEEGGGSRESGGGCGVHTRWCASFSLPKTFSEKAKKKKKTLRHMDPLSLLRESHSTAHCHHSMEGGERREGEKGRMAVSASPGWKGDGGGVSRTTGGRKS